ncbi:hypothetical protein [Marinifilum flexuosum]|uniref:hypothetical protein n=1 Tax=Marinifilum flexuosum TaxID=1117708 RepID=UPI00248FD721|nr:hypothetical protein [Marinifilum flexuosum]
MNEKFLKELKEVDKKENELLEKIAIAVTEIQQQNNELKTHLSKNKNINVRIDKSDMGMILTLVNGLRTIKIPEEIKLKKIETIDIANKTRKWLLYYFACSFLVVILAVGFGVYSWQYEYLPNKELEISDKQKEWMIDYIEYMGKKNLQTHRQFLKENPIPE